MSADFWAGYLSGAAGILIGNPLDLLKTRLQAGGDSGVLSPSSSPRRTWTSNFDSAGALVRGATAPVAGYGFLNAILFVTFNRCMTLMGQNPDSPSPSSSSPSSILLTGSKIWTAGAIAGLATFVVSAPTELVKCRAQCSSTTTTTATTTAPSSLAIAKEIWRSEGVRGLYRGGGITAVRDAVGYGFYFWSYHLTKQALTSRSPDPTSDRDAALTVLVSGGVAGVVTWASIFPLDVIKTRVQTQDLPPYHQPARRPFPEREPLLQNSSGGGGGSSSSQRPKVEVPPRRRGAVEIAKLAYEAEGLGVFFRGLGICSVRAFVVNAVQFAVYELMLRTIRGTN